MSPPQPHPTHNQQKKNTTKSREKDEERIEKSSRVREEDRGVEDREWEWEKKKRRRERGEKESVRDWEEREEREERKYIILIFHSCYSVVLYRGVKWAGLRWT